MVSLQLSGYDFVVLGVFLLFMARGMWLGLLKQVVPLVALYLGYFPASRYHAELLPFLSDFSENGKVVFIGAYVILSNFWMIVVLIYLRSYEQMERDGNMSRSF